MNTIVYHTSFETKLQERLAHPTNWKQVCKVDYSNSRTINSGYVSTVPTVGTVTRDTVANITTAAMTAQTLTISTGSSVRLQIDFGDLAQTGYNTQMELAQEMGDLLNETIETAVLAPGSNWRDIGDSGGVVTYNVTGQITLSAANVDDIIRKVRTVIRAQNGGRLLKSKGAFIIWGATGFELVEAYAQANGFTEADYALKNGIEEGIKYGGVEHYLSNDNAANSLFAGVKGIERVGILRSEYGKMRQQDFPAGSSGGFYEGSLFYTRADYGHLTPGAHSEIVLEINVTNSA